MDRGGHGLALLSEFLERIGSEDPSAPIDGLKELEEQLEEAARAAAAGSEEKFEALKERAKSLRDDLRGADGESMSAQGVYDSLIGILKDAGAG